MTSRPKRARKPARSRRAQDDGAFTGARIRHYCQGIGDCHLLRFTGEDGGHVFILIDCGAHSMVSGGSAKMRAIVDDIATVTDRIDVLVVTHEHWDHVSGFLDAAEQFGRLKIDAVWMAWTEDPADPLARELDTFRGAAMAALQGAAMQLDRPGASGAYMAGLRDGLQALLGFQFGAKGEKVRAARNAAAALGKPVYLGPETPPLALPGVPNLRVYVLGPPRDKAALGVEVRSGEMYGLLGKAGWQMAGGLSAAMAAGSGEPAFDPAQPFDDSVGARLSDVLAGGGDDEITAFVREHYVGQEDAASQDWRRIDADWLAGGAELALRLDRGINNTSLVLAFEFVDTGRVLLFPGDAQAGNWLSWEKVEWPVDGGKVTADDLLSRTVYLKVAHHGSHNAMLKAKGLERMTSPDLAAFIPVNETDAKKARWHEMPFPPILDALGQRAGGRVIRADDAWIGDEAVETPFQFPSGSLRALRRGGGLWIELDVA